MAEFWDVYDENRKKTGKVIERGKKLLDEGEYHLGVTALIMNSKNQILISKRAKGKKYELKWECNGGAVRAGETSKEGILREVKEELGIEFSENEAVFLKEIKNEVAFKDIWLFKRDIRNEEITLPDGEATEYKWVTIEEFYKMIDENQMTPSMETEKELYKKALSMYHN